MKTGSSLFLSAFVLGCASLFLACERQLPADSSASHEAADGEAAENALLESEPNDTLETSDEIPSDSRLSGSLVSDDEDVLRFSNASSDSGSAFEFKADSGYVVVDVIHSPLRWTLTRLEVGQSLSVSPDSLPVGAALALSGRGDWSVAQTENGDRDADQVEALARCRFAPTDAAAKLRWASPDGARNVKVCLEDDVDGEIELPEAWRGRVARLAARSLSGSNAEIRVPTDNDGIVVLRAGVASENAVEAVRLRSTDAISLEATSEAPTTVELSIGFDEEGRWSDIEPNDSTERATNVSENRSPYAGAIHPGEVSDWLEIPWGEVEMLSLTLSLSRNVAASLVWQTVDGVNELTIGDDASSVSLCALWREAGSQSLKLGVVIDEADESAIGWSIRTESPSMASFEREPNEDRLLPLEVPTVEQADVRRAIARFAVPGREPSAQIEGFLGNHGDVVDTIPLRVLGGESAAGVSEIELTLRPPARSDLNLSLVDEEGALVARSLTSGTGNQERIRVSLPSGVYHAVIEHVSGDECDGGYRVEVSTRASSGSRTDDADDADTSTRHDERSSGDTEVRPERDQTPPPLLRRE